MAVHVKMELHRSQSAYSGQTADITKRKQVKSIIRISIKQTEEHWHGQIQA